MTISVAPSNIPMNLVFFFFSFDITWRRIKTDKAKWKALVELHASSSSSLPFRPLGRDWASHALESSSSSFLPFVFVFVFSLNQSKILTARLSTHELANGDNTFVQRARPDGKANVGLYHVTNQPLTFSLLVRTRWLTPATNCSLRRFTKEMRKEFSKTTISSSSQHTNTKAKLFDFWYSHRFVGAAAMTDATARIEANKKIIRSGCW